MSVNVNKPHYNRHLPDSCHTLQVNTGLPAKISLVVMQLNQPLHPSITRGSLASNAQNKGVQQRLWRLKSYSCNIWVESRWGQPQMRSDRGKLTTCDKVFPSKQTVRCCRSLWVHARNWPLRHVTARLNKSDFCSFVYPYINRPHWGWGQMVGIYHFWSS